MQPGSDNSGQTFGGHFDSPPLSGIVIADFSRVLAGPLATMMLGDLGARIIKIEQPGKGDETRAWGPPFTKEGLSAYYLSVNRNKESITLDLTDSDQLEIARQIALNADVVIENFRAGKMEDFGLDYPTLSSINSGLIFCRVSGFGSKAGRELPGYDFMVQALSGLMSITGEPDRPPMKTGVAIVDVLTGLHATIGILAAIHERNKSGSGQMVEVNLMSSAMASLANQVSSYLTADTVPTRMSNQHPSIAPYETFETATTSIVIAIGTNPQFQSLCQVLDSPEMAADPRWLTNTGRVQNRNELKESIENALRHQPGERWLTKLADAGIPCARINSIDEAFNLAQQLGLDAIQSLPQAGGPDISTVSNPISFSRTPVNYNSAPPELGQHAEEILDWLQNHTHGESQPSD